MRNSLFVRLMGAFAAVILAGILVVTVVANQATAREFQTYTMPGDSARLAGIAQGLSQYYQARGSWNGVNIALDSISNAMMSDHMGMGALWLADANGAILASADNSRVGETLTNAERRAAAPVIVNGETVGLVLNGMPMMSAVGDTAAQEFLDRVNQSLVLAALAAGVIALALGFVLFRQITAPLDALAVASDKIAAGDLAARAPVRGKDEIARVSRSFNAMAEQLAQSETARRNMLADIAHELRNPIGVISSHLEAMMDGVFAADMENLASLHDETLLLSRLVGDLRELALADAGPLTLARAPTDLRALTERVVAAFQLASRHPPGSSSAARDDPDTNEQGITLTTRLENLPLVNCDAQRIEQVIRNLVSNALRHTPDAGTVTVTLSRENNFARVTVQDTGAGIAPEALPHVFERFWRGDDASSRSFSPQRYFELAQHDEASKSRSRAQGNTGLGLAIAKQWVTAHGGEIGVESAPGRGSTFWFTLPL